MSQKDRLRFICVATVGHLHHHKLQHCLVITNKFADPVRITSNSRVHRRLTLTSTAPGTGRCNTYDHPPVSVLHHQRPTRVSGACVVATRFMSSAKHVLCNVHPTQPPLTIVARHQRQLRLLQDQRPTAVHGLAETGRDSHRVRLVLAPIRQASCPDDVILGREVSVQLDQRQVIVIFTVPGR